MQNKAKAGRRLYYTGLIAAIVSLIGAELIWLPAPLKTPGGAQWIEMIDWLYYGLSIIPLCWAAGAALLASDTGSAAFRSLRAAIVLLSAALAVCIWLIPKHLLLLAIAGAAAAVVLMVADLWLSERKERGGFPWRSGGAVLAITLSLCALLIPTGYSVTYPAMTMNLNRYAQVEGGRAGGEIDGVLVFDRPAVLADRLYGALFPQYRFLPVPEDEPPLTETYAQVVAMKTDANRVATAIAMQKAGLGKGVVADGVRIVAIVKDSPADGKLEAGDIVDAVNGMPVKAVDDMIAYMSAEVMPGEVVDVTVRRGEERLLVKVPTTASDQDPAKAVFGVSVQTEAKLDTPRSVSYHEYMAHVGGPSHGAMLTLAIIDQLTEGGVTGGLQVAGTGTIELDGSIGMVGGIPQKAYAVSRTGADVFFVPAAGEAAARGAAPDLNIVAVKHIDEVLEWLEEHKEAPE
ncbi:PDZ domain-containing protein [Paenibacillus nanensis]|uniref:PDZ domain-containing protein n=1 Tax=Paenibacillus nanensis TaxID=393251 RepID=A0A3A1V2M7_9BACL|nr:PDZ domain-containing protein [Paenibacillus nanensis]RIX54031.1 PDZ domain-containing protein [Paenibacillus nanensis]